MKCNSCGADIKKTDEICPECGKYLAADPASAEKTNAKTENFGKTLRSYDFNDGLGFYLLLFVFSGFAVMILAVIFMFACTFLGIVLVLFGMFTYFKLTSCSVTLCENGIYGCIPTNPYIPFKTVYFEAYYEDIEKIAYKNIETARHSNPAITLHTSTDKITIRLLKKENTKDLSDCLYELIDR